MLHTKSLHAGKGGSRLKRRPIGVDLFCGVGGMSLGFEQAGFNVVAAFDSDPRHVQTYKRNFPGTKVFVSDLAKTNGSRLSKLAGLNGQSIDVLFGGPPCQGFSFIGKRQLDDPRNALLYDFARLIRELSPRYFVLENVPGLVSGEAIAYLESFVRRTKRAGYAVAEPIAALNASDFGVPQRRKRIFIIGARKAEALPSYPEVNSETASRVTVWDAIGDLPCVDKFPHLLRDDVVRSHLGKPSHYAAILRGEAPDQHDKSKRRNAYHDGLTGCARTRHSPKTVARFAATEAGKSEPVSRFHRLAKEGISVALRAGTGPERGSFMAPRPIHPVYPRCITVREGARLHSFPDTFLFDSTRWHAFRQIGSSVPPFLARAVAYAILQALDKKVARK